MIVCFFFFVEVRCRRMSANDPRGWGHLPKELFASCHARSRVLTHSPKIVDTTSDLILSGWKHLFHEWFLFLIEPTCPRSPHPCQRLDIGAAAGMCVRDGKPLFSWMRETGSVAGSPNTPHKNAQYCFTNTVYATCLIASCRKSSELH